MSPHNQDRDSVAVDVENAAALSYRPKRYPSFSLRTLFWCVTVVALSCALWVTSQRWKAAESEIERLNTIIANDAVIQVFYDRYLILRHDDKTIALRIHSPPKGSTTDSKVKYEWLQVTGEPESLLTVPIDSDGLKDSEVFSVGSGELDESEFMTDIRAGSLRIPWSWGSPSDGWLYLSSEKRDSVFVHRLQLDELGNVRFLQKHLWKPIYPLP